MRDMSKYEKIIFEATMVGKAKNKVTDIKLHAEVNRFKNVCNITKKSMPRTIKIRVVEPFEYLDLVLMIQDSLQGIRYIINDQLKNYDVDRMDKLIAEHKDSLMNAENYKEFKRKYNKPAELIDSLYNCLNNEFYMKNLLSDYKTLTDKLGDDEHNLRNTLVYLYFFTIKQYERIIKITSKETKKYIMR